MENLDFQHLENRLGLAFPDDPVFSQDKRSPTPPPMPFIVGVPRSGTTLLRLMLDAHPLLAIPPETGFLLSIVERPPSAGPLNQLELHRLVTSALNWADLGLESDTYLQALKALHPYSVTEGMRALYRQYSERFGKSRWGDKTANNVERLVPIARILPEAHFIHIIRDGRDVALSLRLMWHAPGTDMRSLARYWSDLIRAARAEGERGIHYMEIRYEDLIFETEPLLQKICSFISLPYDPVMLRYHERARERLDEVTTWTDADGHVIISKADRLHNHRRTSFPPLPERVGHWRENMTREELTQFTSIAGELLQELGYTAPGQN